MSSLLESLEGEPLTEPIFSTVATSAGSTITVALLTFVAAANQGQPSVSVAAAQTDGSFAPQVSVPLRVLDQLSGGGAAPVAISVSKMGGQSASDIEAVGLAKVKEYERDNNITGQDRGPSLLGLPFTITVYDSNGAPLTGLQLAEPMTMTISEEANSSVACAFFNTTTYRWSTEGVRRVAASNVSAGTLQPLNCETDHLSIFGGVLNVPEVDKQNYEVISFEESFQGGGGDQQEQGGVVDGPVDQVGEVVETIIKCTRAAGIFSAEGMAALGKGSWSSSSSALALMATLALFFFSLVAAFARDLTRNQTKWMGQLMSVTYPEEQEEEDEVDEPAEDRAKSFAKKCVMLLHALQASVDRPSIAIALAVRTMGSKEGQELKKNKNPLYFAAMKMADVIHVSDGLTRATNLFLEANWMARMLLLFPATHRALSAGHGSLIITRTSRVTLIFTKILCSCGLAALFFQGSARGNDSEASCIEGGGLGVTIVLGFAAAFVGDVLIYGLQNLRKQNFLSARSNVGLQLKVKEWRVRNALFWAMVFLILVISTYVIMVFFATVTPADSDTWAAAALVVILEEFFVGPFLVAAGSALLATFTMEGDPTIEQALRTATGAVQRSPYNAWHQPSTPDFRVAMPAGQGGEEGQLRALGAAHSSAEAPDVALPITDQQEDQPHLQVAVQQRHELDEQKRLQAELREQLELQKKQLEQQRKMQAELREQLQQQQQEMQRRSRSPPRERPGRYESQPPPQQHWQQDSQVQRLPGVPLEVPRPIVTRPPQQVTSVNLGLQRSVRHGAVVRSGRPGPPSWPPPALRGFDAAGRPINRWAPGAPVPNEHVRRHSRDVPR